MAKESNKSRASIKTIIKSILSGDILLLMRVDRLLPYILFLFILGWINIFLNYNIEQTMAKVEKNKKVLQTYKNEYLEKAYDFVNADKMSSVKEALIKNNSEVTTPVKPAERIKRQ